MTGIEYRRSTELLDNTIALMPKDTVIYLAKDLFERRHLIAEHGLEIRLDESLEDGNWRGLPSLS